MAENENSKDLLSVLWAGADILRGKMDANEYKNYLLGIPRYVDTFEQEEEISLSDIAGELQAQDKEIKTAQSELLSQFAELTASDEQAKAEIAELMKTLEGLFDEK